MPLTKKEAAVITAFTGIMIGKFEDFHQYAEELCGCPVWTHQFGDEQFAEKIKELSRPDFAKLHDEVK